MSLPVAIAGRPLAADRLVGPAVAARPLEPASRVEPLVGIAPLGDARSAGAWGPAARLDLTPLGDAVLRAARPRPAITPARLDLARRLIATEGYTAGAVERAARVLTSG
jgi:hypothetical protein